MTLNYSFKQQNTHFLNVIILYALSGLLCFIYLYNVVQPELLYFRLQPFFSTDNAYIEFLKNYRLGNISLAAQFVLQLMYFPIAGTLVHTAVLLLTAFIFRFTFNKIIRSTLNGIEFIPIIIILASLKNYSEATNTLVLFGISGAYLLLNYFLCTQKIYCRILFHLIAIGTSFFLFGILTSILILVCFITYELINNVPAKYKILLVLVDLLFLCFIIWKFQGYQLFKLSFIPTSLTNKYLSLPVYWYVLGFYPLVGLLTFLLKIKIIDNLNDKSSKLFLKQWYFFILLVIAISFLYKNTFVNDKKYQVQVDYYAYEEKWDKVLTYKDYLKIDDRIPRFQMNRALYHTGRMADHLFSIPQEWGESSLILTKDANRECTLNSSDLFFDMGFINGARYWAYEAQTYSPYSPRILKRLALSCMILKDYTLAKKYLLILKNNSIYKKWADDYLLLIESIDQPALNEKLATFPHSNSDSIYFINNSSPLRNLIPLLESNAKNKMVFEYLMSYFLLRDEVGNMVHYLKNIDNFDYNKIPKTYQQAILFLYMSKKVNPLTQTYKLSKETMQQFENFNKILVDYKMNKVLAQNDLKKYFSDTYWYYLAYDSPMITKRKVKKRTL